MTISEETFKKLTNSFVCIHFLGTEPRSLFIRFSKGTPWSLRSQEALPWTFLLYDRNSIIQWKDHQTGTLSAVTSATARNEEVRSLEDLRFLTEHSAAGADDLLSRQLFPPCIGDQGEQVFLYFWPWKQSSSLRDWKRKMAAT